MAALTFALPCSGMKVLFVDNKAAVACLVRGCSRQPDLNVLTGALSARLAIDAVGMCVRYVPSKLNLADAPSRNDTSELWALGAREVPAVMPAWDLHSDAWLPWPHCWR